ncbi:MAG TPA: HipA N-terminal domain-containing protein [Candidatus Angelobacter sp.]|nr:HipA N-terminal domain-containing protein [Candidatus Angelobacter sp.]
MRKAQVYQQGMLAGVLEESDRNHYRFIYAHGYHGRPISLALPVHEAPYEFDAFPPVFEGLLPEGLPLDAMLRQYKIDKKDLFKQLVTVGEDVVGSLTIKEVQ